MTTTSMGSYAIKPSPRISNPMENNFLVPRPDVCLDVFNFSNHKYNVLWKRFNMADNRKLIDAKRFSFVYTVSAKS